MKQALHSVCAFQHFRGLSFPTISSVGSNAAIIHYGPQAETCAELDPESIYLFDSGAQVSWAFKPYVMLTMIFTICFASS